MRKALAIVLLLALAAPAAGATRHSRKKHRRVKLGLVPHHKGVANLFWMTKPIEGQNRDSAMDGTVHKSLPLN